LVDASLQQELLTVLDRSTELVQALTAFMKPVRAVIVDFTQLKNIRMQELESTATVQNSARIINRLTQFITAKDTRARFANIKIQLEKAMVVLNQAVNAMDLVIDAQTRKIVGELKEDVR
jgi:hypothetical protein